MKINSLLESIGNTPNLRLHKLFPEHEIWIKLEKQNLGGSIKDRISLGMIEAAEKNGELLGIRGVPLLRQHLEIQVLVLPGWVQ